jgi:hypothetical protein
MTLEIKDAGKQLTRDEVVALENEVGAPLPRQYARFLMANNGGVPRPNIVEINGLPTSPTDVQEFFGLGLDIETSNLTWYIREVPERIPMGFLVIACDSGGNLFCISLAGEDAGQVSYLDLT